ncbi:hypothetical protein [Gloeobacter kilaueensis]|uniref:Uncharacterized protein n=1 Tax=Gloeobacter kilaueensis (strain ATCC BAA-2537 / CCAP 1431/1 / ULC 316 / JS1) TaxID=1183438 RepID=U5QRI6_GLOK1|nr:hypothetical protein [Gloeobacter kilaueensis]AGY60264.1 hypothetical protein GKIL_4018 [Gloeobacter kilaueensis JS1]
MQLEFVSVEDFYFALTLETRLLHEWNDAALVDQARLKLMAHYGEPSTIAAARQNTFNYVFRVSGGEGTGAMVELLDWGEQLRLNSSYGLVRAPDGKVNRLESFEKRPAFAREVADYFAAQLGLPLVLD